MCDTLTRQVRAKLRELAALRGKVGANALDALEHSQRIDITFTSNAIEGNTLTAGETALVVDKGLTISGKPLKDHLEAVDHAKALDWVLDIGVRSDAPITESDIRNLHRLVMAKSAPDIAGRYADRARFVNTDAGVFSFPPPLEVQPLMQQFGNWLGRATPGPETAFEAHRRLVAIHPFNDGNGRTARLLMNLVLARAGFPAVAIRPVDRPAYIRALEAIQAGEGHSAFDNLMLRRLDETLDLYLDAALQALPAEKPKIATGKRHGHRPDDDL